MTVSSSFDYSRTGTQIINAALRKIGVLAEGQAATSQQTTDVLESLNLMLKAWSNKGLDVKQIRTAYIYPEDGINELELGDAAGDHEWSLELGLTSTTADAAAAATALTVDTTAADDVVGTTANSDFIGVELDSGDIFWTTISAGGGTTSLTLAAGLTTAAASGNRVYFFTTRAFRPETVLDVYLVTASSGSRRELTRTPESTIQNLDQTEEGQPIQYCFRQMLDDSVLRIWPRWSNGETYIEARIIYPYDDMDAASDTLAFPPAAYEAIVYGLAVRLAPDYKLPLQERLVLKQEAEPMIEAMFAALTEQTSIYFQPERVM
ncbi:MAG: hypothetical protein MN733_36980 [Nitrososphaera sp.]|nr:hypothetical protein [Nitrososphaera sp.]